MHTLSHCFNVIDGLFHMIAFFLEAFDLHPLFLQLFPFRFTVYLHFFFQVVEVLDKSRDHETVSFAQSATAIGDNLVKGVLRHC